MPLTRGTRLGAYEILEPLGAGGMGEVFRARDTKLDRDVAIKILPPQLAVNADALARFEREAKAVATLSHPNILAIFDFGKEGGIAYAVMELLDGETLRDRISPPADRAEPQGGIPARKAVDYAVQIARGLAAAHGKGIVHRDLKPENVFVTTDGRVKILDFGLARQSLAFAGADATVSPTFARHTDPGTVLGTVGYMSPEQVRGEAGDHRSDIFSFGCVLYELLTGRRAFQRGTAAETMTAILREDPPEPAPSSAGGVSPGLARVIQHCLEKNPTERFQNASDVAFALEALSGGSTSEARAVTAGPPARRRLTLAAVALLAAIVIGASFAVGRLSRPVATPVSFTPLTFQPQAIFRALFAPDGKTVVFSAALKGSLPDLFSLSPEYPEPRTILTGAHLLSVSSKGELAVLTNCEFIGHRLFTGTLARMPLGGGAPREIVENVREADWSPDGESLTIVREMNGRDRLEFPIGRTLYESSGYISDPRVSPAGDRIAFFDHVLKYDDRGIVTVVDSTGKKTTLSEVYGSLEGSAWSSDGTELFFSAAVSSSQPQLAVHALTLTGRSRLALASAGILTLHDVSRDGRWLVSRDDLLLKMMVKGPGSSAETNLSWLDWSIAGTLSSDGRMLLFTEESTALAKYAAGLRKTDGSPVKRLGDGEGLALSPDGKWALAVVLGSRDQLVLYPTGAGEPRRLDSGSIEHYDYIYNKGGMWFSDGARILACGNESGRPGRCYIQEVRGGPPQAVTPEGTSRGFMSPNGLRVLVWHQGGESAAQSGRYELYDLHGGPAKPVTGLDRDDYIVRWNPDGESLLLSHRLVPARLERFTLTTGRRELIKILTPPDMVGALYIFSVIVPDDPNVYAYNVSQQLSQLFLVRGAR